MGREARQFMASELGQYLLGCADQEAAEAAEELTRVDPTDAKLIQSLQNRHWRGMSFRKWIEELIVAGQQAEEVLDDHG